MRAPPSESGKWSGPEDILRALRRLWDRGELLGPAGGGPYPMRIELKVPPSPEIGRRFAEVQAWIHALERGSRMATGTGYDLEREGITSRQTGNNQLPVVATFASADAVLDAIGRREDRDRWVGLLQGTRDVCPALVPWAESNPLQVLEFREIWERAVRLIVWFIENRNSGLYLRQIDLPGIDTKFIGRNMPLLRRLLGVVLPAEGLDLDGNFSLRHGIRTKPDLVQLRVLDPDLSVRGLDHFAAPIEGLSRLDLQPRRVVITENEINGMTLPCMKGTVVIFGRGYAVENLSSIPWMAAAEIRYWGDLDTHGFAILDRLRLRLPQARSFLMDEETFLGHRDAWGAEADPSTATLTRLTEPELRLYQDLKVHRWGHRLRLEQERVRYHLVEEWARHEGR